MVLLTVDLYHEDGRLYPNVKFFSQVTGRSAYAEPVLQNIGKSLDLPGMEGTSFRDCILAPEGSSMVKADYSAQELRILAHVAGDENLLNAFVAQAAGSKEPHLVVGEKIAGKELEKGTPEGRTYRQAGKRANYGFSYGAGWKRCQRSVYEDTAEGITDLQAKKEKWAFEGARVIVTTHDEILLECPEEVAEEALGWLLGHMREAVKETIGDELATPDCVEGEAGRSWGS